MKIIVALKNEKIKEKIESKFGEDVYKYDIDTKENVIEYLSKKTKENEDIVLVTRDDLDGNIDGKMYIKQLRVANNNIKIIYVVKRLDTEYKKFLFANEIFNIFEGDLIDVEEIIKCIKEDIKVVYKTFQNNTLNEPATKYITKPYVLNKEIIAIYGTSGSGKSIVSSLIAKKIAKDFDLKVALLDMDIQNPSIDIINNIDKNNSLLTQMVESVDNSSSVNDIISKYMIKDSKNKNLWYITNNCSLFDVQNRLSNKYYERVYSSIYNKSEFTIIDLPTNPFLDVVPYTLNVATKILFVINANYVSIRQALKYIDLVTKLWDNDTSKIYIIINKMQKDSLEITQIKSILSGYKIVGVIDYYKEVEAYINGSLSDLNLDINLSDLYNVLDLKESEKKGIKYKIKRLFENVN